MLDSFDRRSPTLTFNGVIIMNETNKKITTDGGATWVGVPTHPVAAGAGALGGAAAGATVGLAGGPAGAVLGAVVGAVVGGLGGDAVASSVDEAGEADYWRENYAKRPYVAADRTFDDYGPAYSLGAQAFERHRGREFDDVETDLAAEWRQQPGSSRLEWDDAKPATRDAWYRLKTDKTIR